MFESLPFCQCIRRWYLFFLFFGKSCIHFMTSDRYLMFAFNGKNRRSRPFTKKEKKQNEGSKFSWVYRFRYKPDQNDKPLGNVLNEFETVMVISEQKFLQKNATKNLQRIFPKVQLEHSKWYIRSLHNKLEVLTRFNIIFVSQQDCLRHLYTFEALLDKFHDYKLMEKM